MYKLAAKKKKSLWIPQIKDNRLEINKILGEFD